MPAFVAVIRTRRPSVRQQVLDGELERERVAGLRVERVLHHHPVRLALADRPGGPADEAVDRVLLGRIVERELVVLPVELIGPVPNRFGHGISTCPRPEVLISSASYPSRSSRPAAE